MKSTNHIAVGNALVASPAYGATQDIDWSLYDSARLTLTASMMVVSNTLTCSNKTEGQSFDLFLDIDMSAMTIGITWPTHIRPSGHTTINTAGKYHFRMTWINSVLWITKLGEGYS